MPVEVVLGDVEQDGDVGRNAVVVNASWNDDTSATTTSTSSSDGVEQRAPDVAGRDRARSPTRASIAAVSVVTVVLPFVPVTATIAARRAVPQAVGGEVDLGAHGDAGARARRPAPGAPGTPGLGTTRSAARPRWTAIVHVGCFDDGRALGDRLRHPRAVAVGRGTLARRPVLDHRHVVARGARCTTPPRRRSPPSPTTRTRASVERPRGCG